MKNMITKAYLINSLQELYGDLLERCHEGENVTKELDYLSSILETLTEVEEIINA